MNEQGAFDDLQALIGRKVAEGFDSAEEIIESVREVADSEYPALDAGPAIKNWVSRAFAAARRAESEWPPVTDCDRIDRAFELLEARGIVARQNFSCCQNCGHAEIGDEIEAAQRRRPVVGYTFFHMQDTESAAEGCGLYLAYGALEAGAEALVAVGHQIVASLRETGLSPQWNGQHSQRIHIPMTWQKRRWTERSDDALA